jgi:hypothetical protein
MKERCTTYGFFNALFSKCNTARIALQTNKKRMSKMTFNIDKPKPVLMARVPADYVHPSKRLGDQEELSSIFKPGGISEKNKKAIQHYLEEGGEPLMLPGGIQLEAVRYPRSPEGPILRFTKDKATIAEIQDANDNAQLDIDDRERPKSITNLGPTIWSNKKDFELLVKSLAEE